MKNVYETPQNSDIYKLSMSPIRNVQQNTVIITSLNLTHFIKMKLVKTEKYSILYVPI